MHRGRRTTWFFFFFFFNDTATTEIYTLSLHDALPIYETVPTRADVWLIHGRMFRLATRSEEHTSELQSHSFISYAVLCLKKKKNKLTPWPSASPATARRARARRGST